MIENKDDDDKQISADAPTREDLFIRNLYICKTPYEAALEAGYSKNYAKSGIYPKMRKKHFKEKIISYAVENDIMALPKIAYIENQVLDHLMEHPLEESNHKHILKQKKQIAGILGQELPPPKQPTVNIGELKVFWQQALTGLEDKPKPVDAVIVEDTDK
jgi:hypothetical protein